MAEKDENPREEKTKTKEEPEEKTVKTVEGQEEEEIQEEEAVDENFKKDDDVVGEDNEKEIKQKFKKRAPRDDYEEAVWVPKTRIGALVNSGQITSIEEVMAQSAPIKEVQIVDRLLPEMEEEVLDVGRVQRVTDSGRRMRFRVVTAVGNLNGFVGIGDAKGKEAGTTIRKAIERSKLHIIQIKRGCGSWECGCGKPHTVPFKTTGRCGSVIVTLMPAPRGVGIVSGKIAKTIIHLAGIQDVWVKTEGHTRTGINFAKAVIQALENTNYVKINPEQEKKHNIISGQHAQPKTDEVSE
jgi:small subunit ribosomal protein S5